MNVLTGRNLEVQERYLLLSINHDLIVRSILFTFIQSYINIVSNNPDISVIKQNNSLFFIFIYT